MKLMIVGSDKIYSIENFYVKYLREAGVEVNHFTAQRFFYDYYQQGILHKILFKTGLSGILNHINSKFKKEVSIFKPDVIWVFKGMELFPSSLKWAKARGIKRVNFNGDHPFVFSGKGSGNKNVTDAIPLYDLHLTYSSAVKKEIENRYGLPTILLPFGFDMENSLYEKAAAQQEIQRVCFMGNPDEYRGRFLQTLAERNIPLDLYGNDWKRYVIHPSVNIHDAVYADDAWMVLRRYRVQLNMMRPHNPTTHNMRSFELAGIGAIQLAPDTADHRNFFAAGKEIFIYKDLEDCILQINQIFDMDKSTADSVREAARSRCLQSGYSYQARSVQVLQILKELGA